MEQNKFDRNQIIGFVLIGIIMLWFAWWSMKQQPEAEVVPAGTESIIATPESADTLKKEKSTALLPLDSLATDSTVLAPTADSVYVLENQLLKISVSSTGAQIVKAQLKKFQTWDSLPLNLIDSNQIMAFRVGNKASSVQHNYTGTITKKDGASTLVLQSVGNTDKGNFSITLTLPDSSYQLQGMASGAGFAGADPSDLMLDWQIDALRTEKSIKIERQRATIYYWENDESDYISPRSDGDEDLKNIKWIGYKQHFFSSILEPGQPFTQSKMATATFEGEAVSKRMKSENTVKSVGSSFELPFKLYYGPNKYNTLKDLETGYDKIIDFGWGIFGWISRGVVIPIFNWLDHYHLNYGLIILIMALIIKIALFPLTYQSYKSMAKMRVLKPELDVINAKFKDKDAVKKNQAVMELYKEAGVNPLGGCIPMLVQMPILLAMFNFFPASIELRQKAFLWADDLSSFDSIYSWSAEIPFISSFYGNHISLFTILMTISTLIYTYMNSQMQGQTNQIPGMKYIMYGMPVMLLFWFNSYSAGLSYYYFVANVITFTQQWLIRKSVDDASIHAKIAEKRLQPKKKSKFQQRLEEAAKQTGRKLPK